MGKFPHSSLKAHNIFPIHGLAVVVKEIFSSPRLLSHSWGKYYVPFVIHGEIYFPTFVASPLKGKNPIPISPQHGIGTL